MTARTAPKILATEPTRVAAPPVKGTVPFPATPEPEGEAPDATDVALADVAVGYGAEVTGAEEAVDLGTEAEALEPEAPVEDAGAEALLEALLEAGALELEAAVVEAGADAAVFAQAQTEFAADWTWRPVAAPQA